MLQIVALVAVLFGSSATAAPSRACDDGGPSASRVELDEPAASPATAPLVSVASTPAPVRRPAVTEAPSEVAERPSQRALPARPRWRRVPRLRSDGTSDH